MHPAEKLDALATQPGEPFDILCHRRAADISDLLEIEDHARGFMQRVAGVQWHGRQELFRR